jgi:hypothetical protein
VAPVPPTATVAPKVRRPFARSAGILCLIGAMAGCSSGSSHAGSTTPTTSTIPATTKLPTAVAVRAFFAHDGKALLEFERATKVIATGSAPQRATCVQLTRQVLPKIVHDPNSLSPLAQRIPDPVLASAVRNDVNLKVLVVLGCSAGSTPSPGSRLDPKAYTTVRDFANGVKVLLAKYGIAV